MSEIEIYEKYEQMEFTQKLIQLINGTLECAPNTREAAVRELIKIEFKAMDEAGLPADVNGQRDFMDCLFFDFLVDNQIKLFWLESVKNDGETAQDGRIAYLKEQIAKEAKLPELSIA